MDTSSVSFNNQSPIYMESNKSKLFSSIIAGISGIMSAIFTASTYSIVTSGSPLALVAFVANPIISGIIAVISSLICAISLVILLKKEKSNIPKIATPKSNEIKDLKKEAEHKPIVYAQHYFSLTGHSAKQIPNKISEITSVPHQQTIEIWNSLLKIAIGTPGEEIVVKCGNSHMIGLEINENLIKSFCIYGPSK